MTDKQREILKQKRQQEEKLALKKKLEEWDSDTISKQNMILLVLLLINVAVIFGILTGGIR